MLDIGRCRIRLCDGLTRRALLKVGALSFGGFTLADWLRLRSQAVAGDPALRPMSVIQIFCGGGPSQLEMYDPKPLAPAEIRGEFASIESALPGERFSEQLPMVASVADKLAVIRSVRHDTPSHLPASHWMLTGHPTGSAPSDNMNPSCGSVVSKLRGANVQGLPAYVAVPRRTTFGASAYLGGAHNPFTTDAEPNVDGFRVKSLNLHQAIGATRLGDRRELLAGLDSIRRDTDQRGDLSGYDAFYREAIGMITSDRAAKAFDLESEDPAVRERYGRTTMGQNCLLARRLVEAGVTYVTCLSGGRWDTHKDNFNDLRGFTLPRYDRALATLVSDLQERGLDRHVLVMVYGEFGRTPQINRDAGRDHWPGAACAVFAGGGLKMGQIIGATDEHAAYPLTDPHTPGDVLSTMYRVMGIDPKHEFADRNNRPIAVLPEGRPIAALF